MTDAGAFSPCSSSIRPRPRPRGGCGPPPPPPPCGRKGRGKSKEVMTDRHPRTRRQLLELGELRVTGTSSKKRTYQHMSQQTASSSSSSCSDARTEDIIQVQCQVKAASRKNKVQVYGAGQCAKQILQGESSLSQQYRATSSCNQEYEEYAKLRLQIQAVRAQVQLLTMR
ncbi:hypothetical protein RIF29_41044 [Crotalaria pallida]|uniref:Uncharacterized protein n=1 Tax=Crotalaria pallida TaxID=3830 RepID=A0AAN9E4B3_CROPI